MKYDFSAQFLRVLPPDTSFGQAWESLCYALLDVELDDATLVRLKPPDKGVDILHRKANHAYQCKSDERGAFGSIAAPESVRSLKTACSERQSLGWHTYSFASNASYTGSAFTTIMDEARGLGLEDNQVQFLGPEYWDKLCSKHPAVVSDRFDYRVPVSKDRVVQAFKNQRYFDKYVAEYKSHIDDSELVIRVKNNRTPVVLEIPFSPELSVENCVDVIKDLLGMSLEWTNYHDLGTSAGPSISLAIGRTPQGFSKKIKELPIQKDDELQFWITIVWRDKQRDDASEVGIHRLHVFLLDRSSFEIAQRETLSYAQRKQRTIERSEELIETMIWNGVKELKMS